MANPKIGALQSLNWLRASVSSMVCILPKPVTMTIPSVLLASKLTSANPSIEQRS
jgi:hypothetical protein